MYIVDFFLINLKLILQIKKNIEMFFILVHTYINTLYSIKWAILVTLTCKLSYKLAPLTYNFLQISTI